MLQLRARLTILYGARKSKIGVRAISNVFYQQHVQLVHHLVHRAKEYQTIMAKVVVSKTIPALKMVAAHHLLPCYAIPMYAAISEMFVVDKGNVAKTAMSVFLMVVALN